MPLSSVACIGQKYQVDVHIWKTLTNDARPELFSSIKFDPFAGWCSEHVGDTMMQIANNSVMYFHLTMAETVKSLPCIFSVSQSTFLRVLQKMTA